jgi:tetratricopeptide (TPR) repeat protein
MIARQSGDLDTAVRHYQQAVQLWPRFGDAFSELGEVLIAKGQPAEAVPYLQQAVALQPGSPEAHIYLGNAQRRLNDLAQAEQSYRTALSISPNNVQAHLGLAECFADAQRPDEASVEALRALTLATGDQPLRRAAFRLLVRLGKAEAAAQVAPELASTPNDAQSHLEQGDALAKAGRFEEGGQ